MKNRSLPREIITPARRGQIIQRIIVDGWSSEQAACSFGVSKRLVETWVADFHRNGMASLRHDPGLTYAGGMVQLAFSRPLRAMFRKIAIGLRRWILLEPVVEPLPLRRSNEDRQG